MDLKPSQPLAGLPIGAAFIGSCTNSRLSDLRAAAVIVSGRQVAAGVRAIVVPGSSSVKRAAEAEGLDRLFTAAGFEWRESGCSMCFYAGGESFGPQQRVISSTNRNFESRQGPGTRTRQPRDGRHERAPGWDHRPAPGRSMTPFTTLTSIAVAMLEANIDTDIIIPSREIRAVSKAGLADGPFAGWRERSGNNSDSR